MASRANTLLACLAFAALVFAGDMFLAHGAVGAFYVAVVLLTSWTPNRWAAPLAAGACSVLILIGAVVAPDSEHLTYILTNRVASLFAVGATAYAVFRWGNSRDDLATLNQELEQRVERRTADAHQRASELADANLLLEREVRQREQAEARARDSQAVYASLVEDLPIPIIRKDVQGYFVFANRAFCAWVGRSIEEIKGHTDFDFAPDHLAEKYRRDDQSVINTGELFLDVERNKHGGKVNWVHVIKTPARDGEGHIVGTQAIFWDVTAKREAEERLRVSEALYHSLVDTLPLCLLRKNLDGEYTFLNKRWCEFFCVEPEELLGKTDFDVFPPELAKVYRDGDMQVIRTGEVYEGIEEITLRSGETRKISVIKSPVRGADESVSGVQIIFQDVTEELRLAADLKRSEQRLQALLDNTSAVVYIKDADGNYLLVNREYEKLFDILNEEVIGRSDYDMFPREIANAFREVDRQVLELGRSMELEEVAPQKDGLHTYVSSKFPLRNDDGEVFAVGGISTDITSLKRTEQQLRESQQRLNLALTSAEIGAWSWNLETGDLFWDDRMHDIFGLRRDTFEGTHAAFLSHLHEADAGRVEEALLRRIDHPDEDLDVDFRVRWPEGTLRDVTCRGAALRDDRGKTVRITGVCLDITERKLAEQQLKSYAKRLESTNRELEEFAYIVSHDLQEPLRTLQFFSDSLQTDLAAELDEQPRRDLQFIAEAAERMQQLVRDLLTLSRTGRTELNKDTVCLADCVNDAVTALSNRIRETNANVEVESLPQIIGDRSMLTQVFQNLIGNALKFVEPGTTPHVVVRAEMKESTCLVCVIDNGIGIKKDYAEKIFAPFRRLHTASEYEGTGIGLAICRKVVRRHGGDISVDSNPQGGSRFCFELPLASVSSSGTS